VGDIKRGDFDELLDATDLVAEAGADEGVEGGERFVEEQDLGGRREGAGEGAALLLTAGDLVGIPARLVGEADELQ
jgi:hypothetical protein